MEGSGPPHPGAPGSSPPCSLWLTLASRRLAGSRRRGSSVSRVGWRSHRSWALGSVLSLEALSLVLGAGPRVCQPSRGGRGRRLTRDYPWNPFAGHARGLVGSVPSERLSCGGLPPRPASSAARPHTRAVPAEKLRPGAPPGRQPSCSRPSPGGSASSGALFSDHCRKTLPTSGQRRPPWGFRSTSPAPPGPRRGFRRGGGAEVPRAPTPQLASPQPHPAAGPCAPRQPGVGGGNSRESPRPLTHG